MNAPIPDKFKSLYEAVRAEGYHAWYNSPMTSTQTGHLVCSRRKTGEGYRHAIRVFVHNGRYFFLTYGPCCYEAGRHHDTVARACIACLEHEDDIAATVPGYLIEKFQLRPLPLFEWEPLFDTACPTTSVTDMLPFALEIASSAHELPPHELKEKVNRLMWLMRDYCLAGYVDLDQIEKWETALLPAVNLLSERLAEWWREAHHRSSLCSYSSKEVQEKVSQMRDMYSRNWEELRSLVNRTALRRKTDNHDG